jgi:hypothetical protein
MPRPLRPELLPPRLGGRERGLRAGTDRPRFPLCAYNQSDRRGCG